MAKPVLVVMAAGIGSRYGGLKQVEPVGPSGEKIIDYSVYDALRAGFGRVVLVIRKDIESDFREHIGRFLERQADVTYVYQEISALPAGFTAPPGRSKPWGTAQAVLVCRKAVDGPFAVVNADDFYGASSYQLLARYLETARDKNGVGDWSLAGYVLRNTLSENGHVARGVCLADDQGYLREINERLKVEPLGTNARYQDEKGGWVEIPGDSLVSMNMWGFTPGIFDDLEKQFTDFLRTRMSDPKAECLLPMAVGASMKSGRARVKVLPSNEKWFGVTYKEDKAFVANAVRNLVSQGRYPERLWNLDGAVNHAKK